MLEFLQSDTIKAGASLKSRIAFSDGKGRPQATLGRNLREVPPRDSTLLRQCRFEICNISNLNCPAPEPFYASARAAALFLRIISHCWKMDRMLLTSQ